MSIVVQCPHCETKFNLQPDMVGKSMRCPNLDCRQVFTVKPQAKEIEPPKPEPIPAVPRPVPVPPPPPAKSRKPDRLRPRPDIVEAVIVEAAIVAPPSVKEVVWSEGTDAPPAGRKPVRPEVVEETEPDDEPIIRRKKKRNRGAWVLIGMSVAIVALIGFGVLYVLRFQDLTEKKLAQQADEEYANAEYSAAAKSFEKLASEYPTSESFDRYQFFADLAGMQVVVRSVTNREHPDPAIERFNTFVESRKGSPFAQHTSGYGRDIYEAGRKLGEDIAGHADDRVKAYRADRSGKAGELERAEKAVAAGRSLLPKLEPFRAGDEPPVEPIRKDLDRVESEVKRERDRTAALAKAAAQLRTLTDASIQQAENELSAAGFLDDPEAQGLVADAKGRLRELVKYEPDPAAPRSPPQSAAATILFVTPIGPTRRAPAAGVGDDDRPAIFLAQARGILYAIEEDEGSLLWAVRVGSDTLDSPTIATVELETGPTPVALVVSNVAGKPAIAAYVLRTGVPLWYQPLEVPDPGDPKGRVAVPASGRAIVIGNRAYVPLRDANGTIYEFDLTSGTRQGRIRLGQPIGQSAIAVRPGTGLMYVAADARRVYVIDAGARDDDGNAARPRCVQVIATNHLPGTLRTEPLLLGPDGTQPGDRWMILSQADGRRMQLRAFALPPILPPSTDGKVPPETFTAPAAELPVDGWAWFAPVTDGDRLAVVTDFGQFRLFGVNQPGSLDRPLFPLPELRSSLPAPREGRAVRGLAYPAEEAAFWVVANGNLQKFRLGLIPSRGVEIIPVGQPVLLGEPTQPPQLNHRRDAVSLVVRSLNSAGCKAVLANLRTGELRWQRQLGVMPAASAIPQGDGLLLVAEDGGILAIPDASVAAPGRATAAPAGWVIASPPEHASGPTTLALSADGATLFTVTPVVAIDGQNANPRFLIRRVADGKVVHEGSVNAPGSLAGSPVVLGGALLLPLDDGFVHRHAPGTRPNPDTLSAGPKWEIERRGSIAQCHITPLTASSFLTNDGGRKLTKWSWPAGGAWNPGGASWELRERPADAGVVLAPAAGSSGPRLLIADVTGSLWLFDTARSGKPIRRWQPGIGIPGGEPSSSIVLQTDATGRTVAAYTVAGKFLVNIDPERDLPLWSVNTGEEPESALVGPPQPGGKGRWIATSLAGKVVVYDIASGKPTATLETGLPGSVPAVASGLLGTDSVLVSLSDGSSVVLRLPAAAAVAPLPKGK